MKPLFVAADGGPRQALEPLARLFDTQVEPGTDGNIEAGHDWLARLDHSDLLVVGTSDSTRGHGIEAAARVAARTRGVPIAAIEDFPGNYRPVEGGAADLVVVESEAAGKLHRGRSGTPRLTVVPSSRYDALRAGAAELRRRTDARWQTQTAGEPVPVLWAGQPQTDDALKTLAVLLPAFSALKASLLFKAHPRDDGYRAGAYRDLFAICGVTVVDCTTMSIADALSAAPRLLCTQFSSVAIEAGFYGIPSLWVLLPEAGGARLLGKNGYAIPPLCAAGGAYLATDVTQVADLLALALAKTPPSSGILQAFDRYLDVATPTVHAVAAQLDALVRRHKEAP